MLYWKCRACCYQFSAQEIKMASMKLQIVEEMLVSQKEQYTWKQKLFFQAQLLFQHLDAS